MTRLVHVLTNHLVCFKVVRLYLITINKSRWFGKVVQTPKCVVFSIIQVMCRVCLIGEKRWKGSNMRRGYRIHCNLQANCFPLRIQDFSEANYCRVLIAHILVFRIVEIAAFLCLRFVSLANRWGRNNRKVTARKYDFVWHYDQENWQLEKENWWERYIVMWMTLWSWM